MIKTWKDMTVRDQVKIAEINKLDTDTGDKNLRIAAYLAGLTYEQIIQLPLGELSGIMASTDFLLTKPKPVKARRTYTINGRTYNLLKHAEDMTVAQYLDFQPLIPNGFSNSPAEMLSIFLVPEGHKYNDGYDKDQVIEDMYDLGVEEALGIAAFFTKRCTRLIRSILVLLKIKLKLTPTAKNEMVKTLKKDTEALLDKLECMFGLMQ